MAAHPRRTGSAAVAQRFRFAALLDPPWNGPDEGRRGLILARLPAVDGVTRGLIRRRTPRPGKDASPVSIARHPDSPTLRRP